jgi:hypothetical protein
MYQTNSTKLKIFVDELDKLAGLILVVKKLHFVKRGINKSLLRINYLNRNSIS